MNVVKKLNTNSFKKVINKRPQSTRSMRDIDSTNSTFSAQKCLRKTNAKDIKDFCENINDMMQGLINNTVNKDEWMD